MTRTGVPRASAAKRQRWAVETMAVDPDDRVLEIGCGRGVAVSLVAERLTTGKIVAIDRAAGTARTASQYNAGGISSGRAEILCAGFESTDFPAGSFTKIFAVNVSLFWPGETTRQIDRMREILAPDGKLFVFGERPRSASVTAGLASTERLLRAHGFDTTRSVVSRGEGRLLTCVVGTPRR